jgi:hypothetical protein
VIQPVIRFFSLNDRVTLLDLIDRLLRARLSITGRYVNISVALTAFHAVKHVQNEHEILTSDYTCCYRTCLVSLGNKGDRFLISTPHRAGLMGNRLAERVRHSC